MSYSRNKLPEFSVIGQVDEEWILYYDSNIRNMIPKMEWIKKNVGEEHWDKETQIAQGAQEVFKLDVDILMERFNHTEGELDLLSQTDDEGHLSDLLL
ncbi:hypothetical protein NFI96_030954, partial [Prochilodus magdalenae]